VNIKKTLTEFILDYKWLIIGGLILFVPSLILLKFFPVNPNGCTINGFCLTLSSLWGAVTSIFIFDSWINIPVFITLLLIFVFIEYVLPKETIKKQARYSSALMYLTGIAANLVYIILAPTKLSQGPSGVIEGLYGIIFGLTFVNILINPIFKFKLSYFNPRNHKRNEFLYYSANITVLLVILISIESNTYGFLGAGPGINSAVHGIAFILGLVSAIVLGYIEKFRLGR
jgi:hypothetical protein